MPQKQLNFLIESNLIEGEEWSVLPESALVFALAHVGKSISPTDIKSIHARHEEGYKSCHGQNSVRWGEWRRGLVRVASWVAPSPADVSRLMAEYCADWKQMSAWQAHVRFEHIHPFDDGNGRVGRLLWLIKALEEGYDYSIPFLHAFYYQTLKRSQ